MIDLCIPFNSVNSMYYQQSIDVIASMGFGYKGMIFHSFHGYLLIKIVKEVENYVESYHSAWKTNSCTIMTDGLTDLYEITLINRLLEPEFRTLFWSSCVAHCINLMFHDIGKLDEVSGVVSQE